MSRNTEVQMNEFNMHREPLYGRRDIAGKFDVSIGTVAKWIRNKELSKGYLVGRKRFWLASEVLALDKITKIAQPTYMNRADITERLGISITTLYNWVNRGVFPKPIKFNGLNRWKVSEVLKWEKKQANKR